MIQQLLQHLDSLQLNLAGIDPIHDIDAADRVAAIVLALRRDIDETGDWEHQAGLVATSQEHRHAA